MSRNRSPKGPSEPLRHGHCLNSIISAFIVMNSRLAKLFVVAAIFSFATRAFAGTSSIFLAWNVNPEGVAGYKVYWCTSSGVYHQFNDVSKTIATYRAPSSGWYYFAVTAYNEAGLKRLFGGGFGDRAASRLNSGASILAQHFHPSPGARWRRRDDRRLHY